MDLCHTLHISFVLCNESGEVVYIHAILVPERYFTFMLCYHTPTLHVHVTYLLQDNHLLQAMVFTLQVLNELVKCETPLNRTQLPVMMRFLSIAEQILSWEFLPARHIL